MREYNVQISLFIEQKPEHGEDCEPVLQLYPDGSGLLAVFDGAGGAGGTSYADADGSGGSFTGAYLASRLGRKTLLDFFDELKKQSDFFTGDETPKQLEARLKTVFKEKIAALENGSVPKIKSSLIRRLPTTVAIIYYELPEVATAEKSTLSFVDKALEWASGGRSNAAPAADGIGNVLWAGDSRCYLLTAESGLQQITEDDLKTNGDALANLLEDAPMSNFISADVDFVLHFHCVRFPLPAVLLAATDGCFNFVASPAHFEFLLLDALHRAECTDEWETNLTEEIKSIAGDDASMSLVALGWQDFGEIKRAFHARLHDVHQTYIALLGLFDREIDWLDERLQSQKAERDRLRERLWLEYKSGYEYFSDGQQQPNEEDEER